MHLVHPQNQAPSSLTFKLFTPLIRTRNTQSNWNPQSTLLHLTPNWLQPATIKYQPICSQSVVYQYLKLRFSPLRTALPAAGLVTHFTAKSNS